MSSCPKFISNIKSFSRPLSKRTTFAITTTPHQQQKTITATTKITMASTTPDLAHPSSYKPSETAFLLLDYHEFTVSMCTDEAIRTRFLTAAKTLLDAARASGSPILHCLIDMDATPGPTSKMAGRWHSMIVPKLLEYPTLRAENELFAIPDSVKQQENNDSGKNYEEFSYRRPGHKSALKGYGTLELLREKLGVKSLVMCGLSTSGCTLSTASHATEEDFVVTVVEDGCWDPKQETHKALTEHALQSGCWVVGVEEGVKFLKGE